MKHCYCIFDALTKLVFHSYKGLSSFHSNCNLPSEATSWRTFSSRGSMVGCRLESSSKLKSMAIAKSKDIWAWCQILRSSLSKFSLTWQQSPHITFTWRKYTRIYKIRHSFTIYLLIKEQYVQLFSIEFLSNDQIESSSNRYNDITLYGPLTFSEPFIKNVCLVLKKNSGMNKKSEGRRFVIPY